MSVPGAFKGVEAPPGAFKGDVAPPGLFKDLVPAPPGTLTSLGGTFVDCMSG
jgi:hypothetical protein